MLAFSYSALYAGASHAQEKKNLRVVFTEPSVEQRATVSRRARARLVQGAGTRSPADLRARRAGGSGRAFSPAKSISPRSAGPKPSCAAGPAVLDVTIIGAISNTTNYQTPRQQDDAEPGRLERKDPRRDRGGRILRLCHENILAQDAASIRTKDVTLRAIGGSALRAGRLRKGHRRGRAVCAEDTVRLTRLGFPMIANLSDTLDIPQGVVLTRQRFLEKNPETSKRF